LQIALERLPERLRAAVVMQKIDGLSIPEIARRTNSSERTVKRDLADALRALAEIMLRDTVDPRRAS
jgi:DNA-directed RNA polymerase specialized sigma24 family protein